MALSYQGDGVRDATTTTLIVAVTHVTNAVNRLNFYNSIAGAKAKLAAEGSDTNIGIEAVCKGTGVFLVSGSGGVEIDGPLDHDGTTVGFYGVTPATRPTAYTQTYATASRTHSNPTAAALTDNSGGTANTTIQAMPDPTDTPADADALRDDLVANLLPALRNNIADLAAQINALIADQANAKQVLNSVIDDLQANGLLQ